MTDRPRPIADVIRLPSSPLGAFATYWEPYRRVGIVAYPKDDNGKKPAVRMSRTRPSEATARDWAAGRFRSAGLIVRTGRISGLTILDVDTHGNRERVGELAQMIEAHCGETPIWTETPSGGVHLWYRFDGEACRTPQGPARDRLPVDVRGEGGFAVAPPTVTDKGEYQFIKGDLADVPALPTIKPGSLAILYGDKIEAPASGRGKLRDGDGRNSALYPLLCEAALDASTEELFLREAERLNAAICADPLTAAELHKEAAGIWKRKTGHGRSLYRNVTEPYAVLTMSEWQRHGFDPYNIGLIIMGRLHHKPGKPFAINAHGMIRSSFFSQGWKRHRIEKAKVYLAGPGGTFRQVHKGGRGPGDAAQYELLPIRSPSLSEQRAADALVPTGGTNRTYHPLPYQEETASQTARGPRRRPARRMVEPQTSSPLAEPRTQGEAKPKPLPQPFSFENPSSMPPAASAGPGGSVPERGDGRRGVAVSENPFGSKSESSGGEIFARDRQHVAEPVQIDLIEYLGGEPRPALLTPREVYEFAADRRLSQRAIAQLAGIPPGSLFPWLTGKQPLTPENEHKLRRAMRATERAA